MNDWFRSWHGAPTDPKWLVIAKRANVAPGVVSAIVWALFDHASQAVDRGSVADFDCETYAAFSGFDEDQVRAVYVAMEAKAIIVSGKLAKWEKRQPRREDNSAERVRQHRKRTEPDAELPLEPEKPAPPAPAAEQPEVLISPQAIKLADEIAVIAGHDLEFVPPSWCGAASRVHVWLANGWREPLILESCKAQMHRKRDGPPGSVRYFERGIMAAHAEAGIPLPQLKIIERQAEVIHVVPRENPNSGRAGLERLRTTLAATASDKGKT